MPEPVIEEEINEYDLLKNLLDEENRPKDDLAELRKMINKTKKNISDYAEGVYIKSITIQVTI
jgi:hypothetical protein